jgi:capsular polysaccharide biosynthesis protein
MELIRYWRVVYRRWWLIAGLVCIVAVVSLATHDWSPVPVYTVTFRLNVGLEPVPPAGASYEYNPLDVWMTSEYFMDDLASAVRGVDYAHRVAQRIASEDLNPAGAFASATEHRVLTVSIVWGDAEQLAHIANAAVLVLQEEAADLVGPLGRADPVLRLIDPPVVMPVGRSLRDKLDIPIRLGLAFLAGIAGAFLLDYLDTSVRDQGEIEEMGIRVLAQVPRHR